MATSLLDDNIWGALQHHIDLAENVYSKLPLKELFQLRVVCKDWYEIAYKRLKPICRPIFMLSNESQVSLLNGIRTHKTLFHYRNRRSALMYTPSIAIQVVANKGVVLSTHRMFGKDFPDVFSRKNFLSLDPPPTSPDNHRKIVLGMTVCEKQPCPLRSLRIVRGGPDFDTQVYESGHWQTKPCRIPNPRNSKGRFPMTRSVCADYNGRVYIPAAFAPEIFVYDFEKASWNILLSPNSELHNKCPDAIGVWSSRILDVTCGFGSKGADGENWSLKVWELIDEKMHKWEEYTSMPEGLGLWLRSTEYFGDGLHTKERDIVIESSFCADFILVHSWDSRNGSSGRFCLFNMATKNWQKLNIAIGIISGNDWEQAPSIVTI